MPSLSSIVKAYDVRGVVPEQLDERVARALGAAFAEVVADDRSGSVVVGHDMRDSSPGLADAFAAGARSRGKDVILVGLVSTDALYYASGALDCPGAMFTASHNPAQYNGIKLCRAGARPVGQDTGLADVRRIAEQLLARGEERAPAAGQVRRDVLVDYGRHLRDLVDLRESRPLKVVVDAGNGMAGLTAPAVLGTACGLAPLPLDVVPLYFELDGSFPNHEANPLEPANLVDLQAAVLAHGADLGLAFDGDADRCFVVDELGEPVSPSAVTALVAAREIEQDLAAGGSPTVIHNLITSRAVPELVGELGARAVRTRVGHSFIKAQMAEHDAVFGGEHSAHYYFRDFWFADTGMLAAMHVLAALGEQAGPLSALVGRYERYVASGELNSTVSDPVERTEAVRLAFAGDGVQEDHLDGLSLTCDAPDGRLTWSLNLRASNTEPLLRLNVEAVDRATMAQVRDRALALIRA
ncbi:phosphomannomutase/phosphoglucomutase [Angustibacter sp. McL0619]|uniref:phosphomannomutase/phosphoglucomutase n=1 Tax=Angustibacter sp. McL0619 TaxID=3415676 RepID=UPI003CE9DA3B